MWRYIVQMISNQHPCPYCGSIDISRRNFYYCFVCFDLLQQHMQFNRQVVCFEKYHIPVFNLYSWIPNESNLISHLLLYIKGTEQLAIWNYFAQKIACELILNNEIRSQATVLVSCPNKRGLKDHSYQFAQALSQSLSVEHLVVLAVKFKSDSQKKLDKSKRKKIEFQLIDSQKWLQIEKNLDQVIFVDDVVTTGASAYAAYLALGKPKNYSVISIAYRTQRGDLLLK